MASLKQKLAPAKVNLFLHITGKRPDGYHLLESLVVFADVGDKLHLEENPSASIQVKGDFLTELPKDASHNLVAKACALWQEATKLPIPWQITLEKYLPIGAGLGGGSSDAATILNALKAYYPEHPLPDVLQLGADVPVCLEAKACYIAGIGEVLHPLAVNWQIPAVLVYPAKSMPTPPVFKAFASQDVIPYKEKVSWEQIPQKQEDLLAFLSKQNNSLEKVAISLEPAIGQALDVLKAQAGSALARMSGSGSCCFGLFEGIFQAEAAAKAIQKNYPDWWVKSTVLG